MQLAHNLLSEGDGRKWRLYIVMACVYFVLGLISVLPASTLAENVHLLLNHTWAILLTAATNWFLFEHVVPWIKARPTTAMSIIWSIVAASAWLAWSTYGNWAWRLLGERIHVYAFLRHYTSQFLFFQSLLTYNAGSLIVFAIIAHVYNFSRLKSKAQELQIASTRAELDHLKGRINPHFLFNTLNNIYAMTITEPSNAAQAILRLSDLLRFMIYETGHATIPLSQEIQLLNDYLALERLRYDKNMAIELSAEHDPETRIPPLLIMPLAENAFKHGASHCASGYVRIKIKADRKSLKAEVRNTIPAEAISSDKNGGTGLADLRRRLELLFRNFTLDTERNADEFIATLIIEPEQYG